MSDAAAPFITPIALDRDTFMRRLIASLGHLNEGILGSEVAGAYILNVGLSMGAAIEAEYKHFWGLTRPFTLDEYAHVIIDLKQKIHGNFSLVSKDTAKVVVRTTSCPFDAVVRQSPSLCFMTSSVFGGIAARNFGYAKVVLHNRIALGDPFCYVTVHLRRTREAADAIGREYVPELDQASPDIAQQLRIMDQVRRLRRQLSETAGNWGVLVQSAAEAICVLDLAGHISFANARWRDLLGVEGDELVGAPLGQVVHADERCGAQEFVDAALAGERVVGQLLRLRGHRDRTCTVLASFSPVRDDAGRMMGVLGLCMDVTEHQEVQRLKDVFLDSAAHELRTPVTTIQGLTELLLRRIERTGTVEVAQLTKHLATIQQEATRLAQIGHDLLDITRLQRGQLPVDLARHDLNDIVAGCIRRQHDLLVADGPRQIVVVAPAEELWVQVDRWRIEQVVGNLLDNAAKYSASESPVTVTLGRDAANVWVRVRDHGIGIPAQDLNKVFTPFFRGSNVSTFNYTGLGLGLHFSRALAEAHQGHLLLESHEGVGTTATLILPWADANGYPAH